MSDCNDAAEIRAQIGRMAKVSRVLSVLFRIALIVFVILVVLFFAASVLSRVEMGESVLSLIIGLMPFVASAAAGCMLLWIAVAVFEDVAKSQSPFSVRQAKRITFVGVLLLVYAVCEAIVSMSPYHAAIGIADVDYVAAPSLFLDIKLIMASIFCFCLSYVFRYGALLQWLQDETL